MGIKIIGTGSYTPEKVLTNLELEKLVDTSDDWIRTRTGIVERHIAAKTETTSMMGLAAARKALEMAGVAGSELDLIIVASFTGDTPLPSTACHVSRQLGAAEAACFDLAAACSGFVYSLEAATAMMRNSHRFKKALIIGAEKLSFYTDWTDRNTCVLFGDGAGAVVLDKVRGNSSTLISSTLCANGEHADLLRVPAGGTAAPASHETIDAHGHCVKMEGREVFKLAVNAMVKACRSSLDYAHITSDDIQWFVPHQANLRILQAVATRLNIPDEKVYINVHKYGNTSAASIPLAIDELNRAGQLKQGDKLLLTVFGAGMTWGASLLQW